MSPSFFEEGGVADARRRLSPLTCVETLPPAFLLTRLTADATLAANAAAVVKDVKKVALPAVRTV